MAIALAITAAVVSGAIGWRVAQPTVPGGDSVDVEFLHDMIGHHQHAIALATTYRGRGDDRFLGHVAGDVLLGQAAEVGRMNQILDGWNRLDDVDPEQAMGWTGHPVATAAMPGMVAPDDLERITSLSGRELDDTFSRLLIAHHRGGIEMADAAAELADTGTVRTLAQAAARAQRGEVRDLERRRAVLGLPPV